MYKRTEVLGGIHQKALDNLDNKKDKDSYLKFRKEFEHAKNV
mgnify:CR=1 FL=1